MLSQSPSLDTPSWTERQETEISLLQEMYPSQIAFDTESQELSYNQIKSEAANANAKSWFTLRLTSGYPISTLPHVLLARWDDVDLRDALAAKVNSCNCGEEVLDIIVSAFEELVELEVEHRKQQREVTDAQTAANITTSRANLNAEDSKTTAGDANTLAHDAKDNISHAAGKETRTLTTIVWLHHLLAPSKRKAAIHPSSPSVRGISKPGYPGVFVFSGPAQDVRAHVDELKGMKWQAFQVRLEEDEEWQLVVRKNEDETKSGSDNANGVVEVEAMKDVVAAIVLDSKKDLFLEAMRMR